MKRAWLSPSPLPFVRAVLSGVTVSCEGRGCSHARNMTMGGAPVGRQVPTCTAGPELPELKPAFSQNYEYGEGDD